MGEADFALPKPEGVHPVPNPTVPFWHSQLHRLHNHRSSPTLPETSDVLIVGAGYAGVATAYHLSKANPNLSITILEARSLCSGATGRNGGHLRPDLYGHIPKYIERFGLKDGVAVAEFEIAHVRAIKKLIEEENIDCDFALTRTCDVWRNQEQADEAKEVYQTMCSYGIDYMDDVQFTAGKAAVGISGVKDAKACITYTSGSIWPYKFICSLMEIILKTGRVNLQTNTPVSTVCPSADGKHIVSTKRGHIEATKVVYANNAYVSGLLPEYNASIIPCKGVCTHISVPEGKLAPHLDYSYTINTLDGLGEEYLIRRSDGTIVVGGASHMFKPFREQWYGNVDDSTLIDAAEGYFDDYMQQNFIGWGDSGAKVDKIWSGVMGYSWDSNPHVGEIPHRPGQYIVAGFNGHGMPVVWLSAKCLAEKIDSGKSIEDTGLPKAFRTSSARIQRAMKGPEGGDIFNESAGIGNQQTID